MLIFSAAECVTALGAHIFFLLIWPQITFEENANIDLGCLFFIFIYLFFIFYFILFFFFMLDANIVLGAADRC